MKSRISTQGQITVPAEVREQLGLYAGTPVEFELLRDGVMLRKGIEGEHPVDRLYGSFKLEGTTDEILRDLRGPGPTGGPPSRTRRISKRKPRAAK